MVALPLTVRLAAIASILAVAACSSGTSAVKAPVASTATVAAAQPVGPDYVIGQGDGLNVFVWRNPDLSTTVGVRPDGKISIPLVDDLPAVGKTPSQLANDIKTKLGQYVRNPDVTVIVTGFGVGAYDNRIRVVGAGAVKPQAIPYRQGLTLLDIMIEVGLSQFAAGDRAKLVRRHDGVVEETPVKLSRLINRGDLSQNYPLQPGDVVIIPESRF